MQMLSPDKPALEPEHVRSGPNEMRTDSLLQN